MTLQEMLTQIVERAGTDPRYASLVEALMEECPGNKGFPWREWHKRARMERAFVPPCCVNGRVLRLKWGQGELAGALKHWARKTQHDAGMDGNIAYPMRDLADAIGRVFGLPDCNEQAARLVFEVMKKEAAHADPSAA